MRYIVIILALLVLQSVKAQEVPLVSYVRPLVGTSGFGNIYPGSQIPFGGIQISPDTDFDYYDAAAGYKYDHSTLLGFSLTHLSGTGIPDLGRGQVKFILLLEHTKILIQDTVLVTATRRNGQVRTIME